MASNEHPLVFVPPDGRLRLDQVEDLAAEFDQLSREAGELYPASEFARWLRGEADHRASVEAERRIASLERHAAVMRRSRARAG